MIAMMSWLSAESLPFVWFTLIGCLLTGYLILDGFDLGVGVLHLFVPKDETERRLSVNSIGPLWDGNEVWLVTFGGALFAMFPYAYATAFPAFYTAFILLLFALIFRAVSMEFRGKMHSKLGRRMWDIGFGIGSFLAAFLFGVAGGNVVSGLQLNERGDYTGSLMDQLSPYPLACGLLIVLLFTLHGAIFLYMKLTGDYQQRIANTAKVSWVLFAIIYAVVTVWTLATVPRATENFADVPALWLIPIFNVVMITLTGWMVWRRFAFAAFLCNSGSIASMVILLAAALFPNLINATDPAMDLRIVDAASSTRTLTIGLIVVGIGLPFVLIYTTIIYWTFRGKTRLESHSY
ncbi:cytochrome d ubiquinol oxidase subunit II [Crateriforma conspicua]|uniref:Cytochrome bd-I ubiquinol oxidase subunit 2 n=1 Tax=Crateriforma conspicua TaxID=2527996 RepID=A0A5C5XZT2_9PLAN|nr:cytochrome d ubiquinol oxidase subunit II [Crateriforma conspicua]TWT68238.1 Cytochrome bd-I ubiquinol oxidase subunit 2 [Crateriforma conspicua]